MLFAGQHDKVGLPHAPAIPLYPIGGSLKRALDIVIAGATLILLAPLLLVAAQLVLVTMGAPVLRTQTRIGFGGRSFGCYRFRTSHEPGERPTELGLLLERSGIDKLPQLFNVLKGEMSCVGPQPLVAEELSRQAPDAIHYLSARPGMTGMWQLSPSAPNRDEAAALDRAYVHNWSMQGDVVILLRTIPAVVRIDDRA
jgi:exopolysaccharide production protein ExoY